MREEPVIRDGAFDSQNVAFWDPLRGLYVAIYRDFLHGVRTIKSATSPDFLSWSSGEWADYGDAPLEHLYTNAATAYLRAPHIYLAFPMRLLDSWRTFHPDSPWPGVADAVFMSSRDGVHWDRRFMESFIRPGRDLRNWRDRNTLPARGVVMTAPDELSLYVTRNLYSPSNHLERMVVRLDGFVSVHAGYRGGELVTKPLIFQGGNLVLNYATSAAGSLRVELQDGRGNPLPGFSLEESPVIFGDEVEGVVRWERRHPDAAVYPRYAERSRRAAEQPLARLSGKPVRLRLVLRDADLYSLRFR